MRIKGPTSVHFLKFPYLKLQPGHSFAAPETLPGGVPLVREPCGVAAAASPGPHEASPSAQSASAAPRTKRSLAHIRSNETPRSRSSFYTALASCSSFCTALARISKVLVYGTGRSLSYESHDSQPEPRCPFPITATAAVFRATAPSPIGSNTLLPSEGSRSPLRILFIAQLMARRELSKKRLRYQGHGGARAVRFALLQHANFLGLRSPVGAVIS
jgi:hypothetical protein